MAAATIFCALLFAIDPARTERESPAQDDPPAMPLPGPPADEPPADAAIAKPEDARKLSPRRPPEPEDWWLFFPRGIVSVPRLVLAGIFFPISKTLSLFDDRSLARLRRVFSWNRAESIGWRPAFAFQGGYGFSLGARVFHRNLLRHGETLEVEGLGGGLYFQAYQLRFHGARLAGRRLWVDTRGRYDVSPRLVFAGLGTPPLHRTAVDAGPREADTRTRYSQKRALAALRFGYVFGQPGSEIKPGIGVVYNHRRFGPDRSRADFPVGGAGGDQDDPSIEHVFDTTRLVGFREGVDVVRTNASLELDFRNKPGKPSKGFHFIALGGGAPPQARGVAFGHYGAEITGYFNLYNHTRVLVTRVGLEAVHGNDARIPFSELPRLGGPLRLRGYRLNYFRDHKAVFGTIEYRYPIHDLVSGHLFVDGGRVARSYRDFVSGRIEPWRLGGGGGFTFHSRRRMFLRVDLSYGDDFLVFFSTDPLQAFADRHLLEL